MTSVLHRSPTAFLLGGSAAVALLAAHLMPAPAAAQDASGDQTQLMLELPDGYEIEKVVDGLNFPTALAWDDEGQMYVLEAGGALYPAVKEPIRILRVEDGSASEVVDLTDQGVFTAAVGLVWHDGAFYLTHRDADDLTGAVSRATPEGEVTRVFDGLIDSQAEHQINDIRVGPDGRMYVTVGLAGNSGVVDTSIAPWVMLSPELHPVPCQDIVLTGRNFQMPNPMTKDDPEDMVMTGAFVPFGTETQPGQVIEGDNKCGGSILAFDPENAEETITPFASGFRNLLGIAWDPASGEMYAAQNGYDIRGARPVQDEGDPLYRVQEGAWYGVPDFSAALQPLTEERFNAPDEYMAEVFINGESVGQDLGFVIDHEASGLTPPDPELLVAMHPFNSSPSMIDVVPPAWSDLAGHVLVAEWGDLAPPTNPLRGKEPAGYRIVSVDPETGEIMPFVTNTQPGPASRHDAQGQGLDRPFDVQFGPDGALYIIDYGVVEIDMSLTEQGRPPYTEISGTGVIWRVTSSTEAGAPQGEDTQPSTTDEASAETGEATEAAADAASDDAAMRGEAMTPEIVTEGVTIEGDMVTIPRVVAEQDGYVVIHTMLDGQPVVPESIGHAAVTAGVNENVEVTVDFPFAEGEDYLAMLHVESNDNDTYDFGPDMTDVDTPVMVDEQAVVSPFSAP